MTSLMFGLQGQVAVAVNNTFILNIVEYLTIINLFQVQTNCYGIMLT